MTPIKEAITTATYAIHRALILNELISLAKTHPNPLLIYDDQRLRPKSLKAASNCTTLPLGGNTLPQHINQNSRPILVATKSWQQIDPDTAAKVTKSPYVLYTAAPATKPPPGTQYFSNRILYSLASNFKDTALSIHPYIIIFLLAILLTALSTTGNFIPPDDYARHAKAYQYHYDYSLLYPYSQHPSYDSYILFDLMAGTAQVALGAKSAALFQLIPFILTMLAVHKLSRPATHNMTSLIMIATAYFTWQRFQSARPCILMSSIFLFLYANKDEIPALAHYLAGTLMAALYHIFFVYTIPLWLPRKTRIPYIAATVTGILFWAAYSSGTYFSDLSSLATTKSQLKALGIQYAELQPIIGPAIFSNFAALAPLLLYFRGNIQKTAMTGFFLLLNQVRYLETAIPLSLSFLSRANIRISALVILAALAIFFRSLTPVNHQPIQLQSNSKVLTYSSALMNSVISGSDNIAISPSPNLPWDNQDIQQHIVKTVKKGEFDCTILHKYPFDYIVENHFNSIPACLTLKSETPRARIWTPKQNGPQQTGHQ